MKDAQEITRACALVCKSNTLGDEFEVIGELNGKTCEVISVLTENGVTSFATRLPKRRADGVTAKYHHPDEWENIRRKEEPIGKLNPAIFDAVALLNVYFFADLAYPGVKTPSERRKLLKKIKAAGYLEEITDVENCSGEIFDLYNEALEAHVEDHFPKGWAPTHDYWGAKCFELNPGWNAPKHNTYFAGDSSGHYAAFDSAKALWERTHEILDEIEEAANCYQS